MQIYNGFVFIMKFLSVALFTFLLPGSLLAQQVIYVSPQGNDQWSGRKADSVPAGNDGPLATVAAAQVKVRELLKTQQGEVIEVQIRGGLYRLTETLVFGLEDSGTETHPVTYKAYADEKPVFSGGVPLTQWKPCTEDPAGTAAAAAGKLWYAELPADSDGWQIKSLYDNDGLLKRAISGEFMPPNKEREIDFNTQGKTYMKKLMPFDGDPVKPFDRNIYYQNDDLRAWENIQDIEVVLRNHRWAFNLIPLASIDVPSKTAVMAVDPTYQPSHKRAFWVENAIDHLDEPGEWVFNSKRGQVYFWPNKPMDGREIIAPRLQEFIRVEGVEDGKAAQWIRFEGLRFRHGLRDTFEPGDKGLQHDWEAFDKGNAVVRFRNAEHCTVDHCEFSHSSGTGIRLDQHCQHVTVSSNLLEHLGSNGIVLSGYGPGTKDENKHNVVTDNYIHHIGELYWHACGIFVTQSGHNKITHNTIEDVPYNGIVISGCRPHEFYIRKRIPFRRAWVSTIRAAECEPFIEKALKQKKKSTIAHFLPLVHARENDISMNEVSRTLLKLGDGNAVYFSAMGENNRLERNFLHHNYHVAGTVRLDDNPSYTIIHKNVIMDSERGIGIKGPCKLTNNFVIDVPMFLRGDVRLKFSGVDVRKLIECSHNIFFPPKQTKETRGYYVHGRGIKDLPFHDKLPRLESSIYFSENPDAPFVPKAELGTDLMTSKSVTPGEDDTKLLYADPMFDMEAMKGKIFRFLPGSPAEKLGIEPIDLSNVGSSLAR